MKNQTTARNRPSPGNLSAALMVLSLSLAPAGLAGTHTGTQEFRNPSSERGAEALRQFPKPKALPSDRDTQWLRELNDVWQACPKTTCRYNTLRGGHELRVALHCLTPRPERPLLLFVHGVISDHRTWRHIAGPLSAEYEVWLVDLPGSGDSDAPSPASLESDGYSATAMAERLLQAFEQGLARSNAGGGQRRIVLVGHSLGGMVCLRMLSSPELRARHASFLAQVNRAVLMSTSDFEVNSVPTCFIPLLGLSGWKVSLGEGLGVFDSAVRDMIRNGYFVPECATAEQQAITDHMLSNGAHRRTIQAILIQSVPFNPKTHRPDWPAMSRLAQECALVDKPVLVVWGEWDEVLPSSMGHQLKDKLPRATLVTIPGRGHSLPGEDPVRCATLIREFVQDLSPGTLRPDLAVNVYRPAGRVSQTFRAEVNSSRPRSGL